MGTDLRKQARSLLVKAAADGDLPKVVADVVKAPKTCGEEDFERLRTHAKDILIQACADGSLPALVESSFTKRSDSAPANTATAPMFVYNSMMIGPAFSGLGLQPAL